MLCLAFTKRSAVHSGQTSKTFSFDKSAHLETIRLINQVHLISSIWPLPIILIPKEAGTLYFIFPHSAFGDKISPTRPGSALNADFGWF